MFAWQHTSSAGGVDKHLKYTESVPLPDQPPGSVLVKVLRTSLNPVDYKMHEIPLLHRFIGHPASLGGDFVGRVVESSGMAGFESGDLVVGKLRPLKKHGTLAEYITVMPDRKEPMVKVDEPGAFRKLDELAGIPTAGTTALRSLKGVPTGGRVFINGGSGGTGMYGVQIAKHMGLEVVVTCSARNEAFVRGLGADEVIDYTKVNVVDALKESVRRAGRKFDRIIDNVGSNPDIYWNTPAYLIDAGLFIIVGAPVAASSFFNLMKIFCWPRILGGGKNDVRVLWTPPVADELKEVADLMLDGKIRTEMESFPLEQVPDAVRRMKSGRTTGKIVVKMSD